MDIAVTKEEGVTRSRDPEYGRVLCTIWTNCVELCIVV
jgi:hypothetical protein